MGGQSNIFNKPDSNDPFGASVKEFQTGVYNTEKRPNIDPKQKQAAQAQWEKVINNPGNRIK